MTEQYVYGLHAVKALLRKHYRPTYKLYINERVDHKIQAILEVANEQKIPVEKLSTSILNQRFADFTHQGIVASVGSLPEFGENDLVNLLALGQQPYLILILDGITDPHNLGACLRTADAAGVDFIIIPKDKSAGITPIVSKVACGAAEAVPIVRVTNLVRAMEIIKQQGIWIYGAAGEATQTLYQMDCCTSLALVMGAEEKGIRRLTREHCDGLFSLPMMGTVESLNVSVATGISLFEVGRQRHNLLISV